MLKLIIFLILIFSINYLIFNFIISKKDIGIMRIIIPISFTLLIFGIIFTLLPRFGINPFIFFQLIIPKIVSFFSMLRGINLN